MEFKDINTFLRNHTGEEWFTVDAELYKKVFPSSKLIPELEKAQKYNKAHLDERICSEMMLHGAVCDCSILENRGYTKDSKGFIVPMKNEPTVNEFEQQLLDIDLDAKQPYNALKSLIFGLAITTKDAKGITYIEALKAKKVELQAVAALKAQQEVKVEASETNDDKVQQPEADKVEGDTKEVVQPIEPEKKSEGGDPGPSTQE
jgi:hypothetical protein